MRLAIISSACPGRSTRSVQRLGQLQHGLDLVLHHAAHRDAGPVLHHAGTACSSTVGRISGDSPCKPPAGLQAREHRRAVRCALARPRPAPASLPPRGSACLGRSGASFAAGPQPRPESRLAVHHRLPPHASGLAVRPAASARRPGPRPLAPVGHVDADRLFAADDLARLHRRLDPRRWQSSSSGGVACWLTATRAQAVSSRLTALSGSCRPGCSGATAAPPRRSPRRAAHAVVLLQDAGDAAQHQHRLLLAGLVDLHHLEAAGERRVLLDVLLVFGPGGGGDGAQLAARQRRLEQVGRVAGAGGAAGADQRVRLVDEQDDRLGRGLHLVDHRAQPVLELALHAGAGLQQPDVEPAATRPSAAAARRRWRCAGRSPRPPRSCRRRPRR